MNHLARTVLSSSPEETHGPRLHSLAVTEGSFAAGKTLGEIELEVTGSRISSIRRQNQRLTAPPLDTLIEKGDVLVLMGTPEQLAAAELRLLKGRSQRR